MNQLKIEDNISLYNEQNKNEQSGVLMTIDHELWPEVALIDGEIYFDTAGR